MVLNNPTLFFKGGYTSPSVQSKKQGGIYQKRRISKTTYVARICKQYAVYRVALIQSIGISIVVTNGTADIQVTSDRPLT